MENKKHFMPYPDEVKFSLLVISDEYDADNDVTGRYLIKAIGKTTNILVSYRYIKNDKALIQREISDMLSIRDVESVIITGGTGLSKTDIALDIVSKMFEKRIDGFGELYRNALYREMGVEALRTRACAGVINDKVVFCLPGSTDAVKIAIDEIILPGISLLVQDVRY